MSNERSRKPASETWAIIGVGAVLLTGLGMVQSGVNGLRDDMREDMAGVRSEMSGLRSDMREDMAGVRSKLDDLHSDVNETNTRLIVEGIGEEILWAK